MNSWSDLPIDLLRTIGELLHYTDLIRMSAVCKSWWRQGINCHADEMPWVFSYDDKSISNLYDASFYLYDPFYKKKYTIDKPPSLAFAKILASKHGWLLFCKEPSSFFFYSPFNNKIIELPPLIVGFQNKAIFWASPGSSNCVVFVVSVTNVNYICISTCRPGDSTWTQHCFGGVYSAFQGITCVNGLLYCAFSFQLCTFNHEKEDWKIINLSNPIWIKQGHYSNDSSLIEADGNLFLIYYNGHQGYYKPHLQYRNSSNVLRFDWQLEEWIEVEDLGKKLLFVGNDSHSSMLVPAIGEVRNLANSIHFAGDTKERYVCYSYGFDMIPRTYSSVIHGDKIIENLWYSHIFLKERGRKLYPQLYDWIKEERSYKKNIFLQPS